ncbi:lipopolysaccharide biosynthesis protein [Cupriavidus pinatubonensis]|uniref:lipopolysaccharide biosynthesis protein n=1 Tax=Cupriavidus pinatubonensis TaxID=248026 RepID=UPI00360E04EC
MQLQGRLSKTVRSLANPSVVVFERIAQICVTLLVTLVIARRYGTESYGLWQVAQSFFVVTSALCLVVPGEILLPRFKSARDWGQRSVTLTSALVARGGAVVLILLGYLVALLASPPEFRLPIQIALLLQCSVAITEPVNTFSSWYLAQSNNVPVTLRRLVGLAVRLMIFGACVLAFAHPHLVLLASAWPIEAAVAALLVTRLFLTSHEAFRFEFSRAELVSLLRAGMPVWWGFLLYALFLKADRLYLPHHMDGEAFGLYGGAAQLVETAIGMVVLVVNTLVPRLIYRDESGKLDRRLCGFFLALVALACGGVSLFASNLMHLFFGVRFVAGGPVLACGIWLTLLAAIETLLTAMLIKRGVYRGVLAKWTLAAGLQYGVLTATYPEIGLWGVLAAYVTGYSLTLAVSVYLLSIEGGRRRFGESSI